MENVLKCLWLCTLGDKMIVGRKIIVVFRSCSFAQLGEFTMASVVSEDDVIQVTVHGIASGQAIDNVIHYRVEAASGNQTLETFLANFQLDWRDDVLPVLSASYRVLVYEAARISAVLAEVIGPPGFSYLHNPKVRFNAVASITGSAIDDIGEVAGAALPTYTALGYRKVSQGMGTGKWGGGTPDADADLYEKTLKGSIRLSTIPEAYTEAATQNALTAAAVTDCENALDTMLAIATAEGGGAGDFRMCIFSLFLDQKLRHETPIPTPPRALWYSQLVNSVELNPLVTSQVSRKQKSSAA